MDANGDGLIVCEWKSQRYEHSSYYFVCFGWIWHKDQFHNVTVEFLFTRTLISLQEHFPLSFAHQFMKKIHWLEPSYFVWNNLVLIMMKANLHSQNSMDSVYVVI